MSELLNIIVETLDQGKANDVSVVDFKRTHPLCDYFVIADAPSLRQVNALADHVLQNAAKAGFNIRHQERTDQSPWVLLDFNDVIVHLFITDERAHYKLDKLYQDFIDEK